MKRDNALIISKLLGGGSLAPLDADYRRIADLLSLQRAAERRTQSTDPAGGADAGRHGLAGNPQPILKEQYDALLAGRQQLMQTALMAVRALMDYDRQVLPLFMPAAPAPQTATGVAEAVRQCAPLVERKGDWAALYMLLQERGHGVGYTELCRLVAECAPGAPQPSKQDIAASEWLRHGRRFPDWQPEGVRYDKFRRHYLIAQQAIRFL